MNTQPLQQKFSSEVLESGQDRGQGVLVVRKDRLREILEFARNDPDHGFDLLMDVCGVDYLALGRKPRFEVVYQLYSTAHNQRLRVKVPLAEDDLMVASMVDLWKSANWFEREIYDMFGIHFEGHPHLKRLLMFEGFEGHPLRKDYPISQRQEIPVPEETL